MATGENSVFLGIGDSVMLWCCRDSKDVRGIVVDTTGNMDSIVDADFVIVSYPLNSTNLEATRE